MKLSLTELQWGEVCHKLSILTDEPDLQDSYDLDQRESDVIYELFYAAPLIKGRRVVEFDDDYIDLLIGEIENTMEIASANIEDCGDDGWRGIRSSLGRLKKELINYQNSL